MNADLQSDNSANFGANSQRVGVGLRETNTRRDFGSFLLSIETKTLKSLKTVSIDFPATMSFSPA